MSEYRNPCVFGRELARIIETEQFMSCCIKKKGSIFMGNLLIWEIGSIHILLSDII